MPKKLSGLEWTERVESGSLVITADGVQMRVRGGGIGSRGWVARITDVHPKFKFERDFLRSSDDLSRSGKSGSRSWTWPLDDDGETIEGLYEYRDLCTTSSRSASGFLALYNGRLAQMTEGEAVALLELLAEGAPMEWIGAWGEQAGEVA